MMNIEELVEKVSHIDADVDKGYHKIFDLTNAYIEEHAKYKVGDKIGELTIYDIDIDLEDFEIRYSLLDEWDEFVDHYTLEELENLIIQQQDDKIQNWNTNLFKF